MYNTMDISDLDEGTVVLFNDGEHVHVWEWDTVAVVVKSVDSGEDIVQYDFDNVPVTMQEAFKLALEGNVDI